MILATRLARKRSASTRMRAHSRGLMLTRRSKRHASGLQTAFEEKTDFSLLTDLTRAVPHRARALPHSRHTPIRIFGWLDGLTGRTNAHSHTAMHPLLTIHVIEVISDHATK